MNSPGVGRNLIDHPMAFVVAIPVAGIPHDPQVTNPIGIRYTATGSDEFNDMQMYILELFDPNLSPGLALDLPVPSVSLVPDLQRPRSRGQLRLRSAEPTSRRSSISTISMIPKICAGWPMACASPGA